MRYSGILTGRAGGRAPGFRLTAAACALLPFLLMAGCKKTDVVITGVITEYAPGDTVFVTLTMNWTYATSPPARFEINRKGEFELELSVRRRSHPITFVKNNRAYARLRIHNLGDVSADVFDEVRGGAFNVKVGKDGVARVKVKL